MRKLFVWALAALLMPASAMAQKAKIRVANDERVQRQEVVEVDAAAVYQ